jgi:hypothetical protein
LKLETRKSLYLVLVSVGPVVAVAHGTLSLYAALDVRTGKVQGKTAHGIPVRSS